MSASTNQRARIRAQLAERVFDIAIIGGGINGAAIARDAALRGYSVVLLEQDDFGAGTSSRSSGLLHGGVRYLEHAEFSLVFEALTERTILARRARHIARPIRFIFPIYDDSPRGMFVVNLGMWLYDVLALYRNYRPHRRLRSSDIRDAMPPLLHDGLRGAMAYYDYQTDDARMVLENVLAAQQAGAIALSRLKVLRVVRGTLNRLELQDMLDGAAASVAARTVVCAAGPWADDVLRRGGSTRKPLRPTKGVHIVLPRERIPIDAAVVLQNAVDRRVMFALPYFEHTVVGTTDTIYAADPGEVRATGDDVEYLLEVANAHFPDARVTDEDIISNWAGVRPLVAQDDNDSPGAISREHRIDVMLHGWVTIAGGKLTTYRKMASECVDRVAELLAERGGPLPAAPAPTAHIPLPGGVGLSSDADLDRLAARLSKTFRSTAIGRHLAQSYGVRALALELLVAEDPTLAQPIVAGGTDVWAQLIYGARTELVLTLEDFFIRRTAIFFRDRDQGLGAIDQAARLLTAELGWDQATQQARIASYRSEVERNRLWRREIRRSLTAA